MSLNLTVIINRFRRSAGVGLMKSAFLPSDSIGWIFYFIFLQLGLHLSFFVLFVCNSPPPFFYFFASPLSWMSLCLGPWAGFWQGLLSLKPSSGIKRRGVRQALSHYAGPSPPRLWLRVVIQNWCGEEQALTSCQPRMFSTGRQPSRNDNVGYARWALTTPPPIPSIHRLISYLLFAIFLKTSELTPAVLLGKSFPFFIFYLLSIFFIKSSELHHPLWVLPAVTSLLFVVFHH